MHFLREQFEYVFFGGSNIKMCFFKKNFWNTFFEEAITLGTWVKWLLIHDCWLMWPVFFIKIFTTSKASLVLICLNINLELLLIGCNQARYKNKDTCLECLPPLLKTSASLGKGWVGSTWWPMGWHGVL